MYCSIVNRNVHIVHTSLKQTQSHVLDSGDVNRWILYVSQNFQIQNHNNSIHRTRNTGCTINAICVNIKCIVSMWESACNPVSFQFYARIPSFSGENVTYSRCMRIAFHMALFWLQFFSFYPLICNNDDPHRWHIKYIIFRLFDHFSPKMKIR